jgi:hypothetical protein
LTTRPEVWLRGPVAGVPAPLQPVAHALLQAREDAERLGADMTSRELWASPGGAASIGFHLRHAAGSLDRLLTYARGESLSEDQRVWLAAEQRAAPDVSVQQALGHLQHTIERALAQLRSTPTDGLDDTRPVGRSGLPSTVRGLLCHAGEHTARHVGQISTTLKIMRGLGVDTSDT